MENIEIEIARFEATAAPVFAAMDKAGRQLAERVVLEYSFPWSLDEVKFMVECAFKECAEIIAPYGSEVSEIAGAAFAEAFFTRSVELAEAMGASQGNA
ncbi:hypothetical protein [Agrobacterium sp. P15N1-A]|uniref:hypothetical protein n=1 Tax=Agrobacterium sp. P15N1-A TaxID=3342820 RepID=UPI0037CD51F8